MEFSSVQKFTARLSDKYFVSDDNKFLYLKFELVLPDRLSFRSGQYVSLKVNEKGERRCYSVVSTPDNNHGFHLLAEIVAEGKGSTYLQNLELGEVIEVLGPLGKFVVPDTSTAKNLLFVATGSGIAPVYSMINDLLLNKHDTRQIRLHLGMRSESSTFFFDNLERLMEEHPNFVFDLVLSKPSDEWELCRGHVQDCLKRDFLDKGIKLNDWEGFVCGNPTMIKETSELLLGMGMDMKLMHYEKFT
jgi:NAD(P)H-flavin reductase